MSSPNPRPRAGDRWRRIAVAVLLVAVAAPPAVAQQLSRSDPTTFASEHVEHLGTVATPGVVYGGTLHEDYLYVAASIGLIIFRTGDGDAPLTEVSTLRVPTHSTRGGNERPATNGRILLLSVGDSVWVVDVSDKANPRRIGAPIPGKAQHLYTCLFDCAYAYGSDGLVLDLRTPERPRDLETDWTQNLHLEGFGVAEQWAVRYPVHHATEVAPGLVLTASIPMHLLEVDQDDPADPRSIATSPVSSHTWHSNAWPNAGRDSLIITVTESVNPHCATQPAFGLHPAGKPFEDSAVHVWDARDWRGTGPLHSRDTYRVRPGTFTDGQPPIGGTQFGCAMHWFDPHPRWRNGGVLAAAAYAHGVRFLLVDRHGNIDEAAWFLPVHANTQTVFWGDDGLVYALDMHRGVDVLRYNGPIKALPAKAS